MADHGLGVDRDHGGNGFAEVPGDPVKDVQRGIGLAVFKLAQIALRNSGCVGKLPARQFPVPAQPPHPLADLE